MHLRSSIDDASAVPNPNQEVTYSTIDQAPEYFRLDNKTSCGHSTSFNSTSSCYNDKSQDPGSLKHDKPSYNHNIDFNEENSTNPDDDYDSEADLPNFSLFPHEPNTSGKAKTSSDSFNRDLYEANVTRHLSEHLAVLLGGREDGKQGLDAHRTGNSKPEWKASKESQFHRSKDHGYDLNSKSHCLRSDIYTNRHKMSLTTQTLNTSNKQRPSYNNKMEKMIGCSEEKVGNNILVIIY